ncbi:diguanylate cyclase [Pseudonocardia sp. MCCB 268]|nr:diguanylate cyclase [Pseudonocardia cytotoxica]
MTSEVREGDAAGRFGGEEFVVVLSSVRSADDGGAAAVREAGGERIRRRVEGTTDRVPSELAPVLVTS